MTGAPVVGIVAPEYVIPRPFGALPVTGGPTPYIDALIAVGGRPLLLPGPHAPTLLDLVDAVVLTGGGDVDPLLSGAPPGEAIGVDRARDDAEITLARAAASVGLPVLGVCRGMQVLAVAFGGTLGAAIDHILPSDGHAVTTSEGSVLRDLLGPRAHTSALHHQAVVDPGDRWRATAWTGDGVVEGIEPVDGRWSALGIQWHPELAWSANLDDPTGPTLFAWLCDSAAAGSSTPPTACEIVESTTGAPHAGSRS